MGTFLNAVKNLINSLTAKTSSTASTADMVQLHDANGNPNGKISLADLASVLGGATLFTTVTDPDSITSAGFYQNSNWDTEKAPAANGILIVPFYSRSAWKFQLFVNRNSAPPTLYFREGTSMTYSSWKKLKLD